MKLIGKYKNHEIFWFDYSQFSLDKLPKNNWLCFAFSYNKPDEQKFDEFVRYSIERDILEFKGLGTFGEKTHDIFDEIMINVEVFEKQEAISVITTWQIEKTIKEAFWNCLLSAQANDIKSIKIVCTDIDGHDRASEIENILEDIKALQL